MDTTLSALLEGKKIAPLSGEALHIPTQLIIRPSLIGEEEALLAPYCQDKKLGLVCDKATYAALGERLEPICAALGEVMLIGLNERPKADDATAARIRQAAEGCEILLAVGSGTINDLTQVVSGQMGIPYICFPTAPSMNGYLSANASMTIDGYKQSVPAPLPQALLIDLDVLAKAPTRLIRAGLADSLCRSTVQTDWLLSHHLLGTPYSAEPFNWVRDVELRLCADPTGLLEGDLDSMEALIEWLLLSGIAMTACGSSMPASQGEHMIAHAMDMALGDNAPAILHGEAIAVTSLTMAALQDELLTKPPTLTWREADAPALEKLLGEEVANQCLTAYTKKNLTEGRIETLNDIIAERWDNIARELEDIRLNYEEMEALLAAIGAPLTPGAISWPTDVYDKAVKLASLTRERFTCLDIAYFR